MSTTRPLTPCRLFMLPAQGTTPMPALRIGKRHGAVAAIVRHGSDVIRRTLQQLDLPIPAQEPYQSIDGCTCGFDAMTAMETRSPQKLGNPRKAGVDIQASPSCRTRSRCLDSRHSYDTQILPKSSCLVAHLGNEEG